MTTSKRKQFLVWFCKTLSWVECWFTYKLKKMHCILCDIFLKTDCDRDVLRYLTNIALATRISKFSAYIDFENEIGLLKSEARKWPPNVTFPEFSIPPWLKCKLLALEANYDPWFPQIGTTLSRNHREIHFRILVFAFARACHIAAGFRAR